MTASLPRRGLFLLVPYAAFALALAAVEGAVRLLAAPVTPLDFLVTAPEQQAQFQDARRQRIFEGDPLLFWRLAPGLRDVVWDQTPVTTNAQGLRYSRDVGEKTAGTFRMLCVGDSVTFGFRVPLVFLKRPEERHPAWLPYPARIENALRVANSGRAVEVIPLAVPGYSTHQGRAWLRRDLARYRPDVVTLLFGWNDVSLRGQADAVVMKPDRVSVLARGIVSRSQALMRASRLLHAPAAPRAPDAPGAAGVAIPRVDAAGFVANHREMVRLARAEGAAVAVIGPVFRDPVEHPEEAARMAAYRAALREAMRADGVPYLEVPELTESAWPANQPLFLEHIHPNHAGHRVLAEALLAFLARQSLTGGLRTPVPGTEP